MVAVEEGVVGHPFTGINHADGILPAKSRRVVPDRRLRRLRVKGPEIAPLCHDQEGNSDSFAMTEFDHGADHAIRPWRDLEGSQRHGVLVRAKPEAAAIL